MKNVSLVLLCFIFLFFSSCEEELINNSQDDYAKLVEEVKNESEILFQNEMYNYFGNNEYVFSSNSSDDQSFIKKDYSQHNNKIQQVTEIVGPISTNLPQYGSIKNQRLYLSNQPGLAAGIYFCDIYSYYKEITLPTNALVGYVNTVNPQGFSNYSTQTVGFTSSTSSSNGSNSVVLSVLTYKIHVRYTVTGASINKVLPSNLNNVSNLNLTYSYVTP